MLEPPSQSPTATCYSPGGSLASDGTISDYAADVLGSPSPSLASPGAGSPPPHPHPAGATTGARKPQRRGTRAQYTAEEKERRRKVSHSAIEKRRRERTNSVLNKLQRMVPGLSKSSKIQKLEILQASAVYICELRRQLNLPSTAAADDDEDGDASDDDGCCSDGNGTGARSQMKVDFLLT
ncbi:hypothetical protein LPJ61_001745 [Coemansia biformis]|uniref:BHLH domain-containing protein n=1 Tax=Coemansia biformis TaxID=1286918 RepID=A0A9W7YEB5_9FUNG|nr:hypothetical protein LPJ61_001745 [Coemansia biformis]